MIDQLNLLSMFPIKTGDPKELDRVLAALEAEPLLVPTQASINDQKRGPYSKDGVLKQLKGETSAGLTLWRTKAPKQSEGFLTVGTGAINSLEMDPAGGLREAHVPQLFEAWTRLADAFHPEFAFVHMMWDIDTPESNVYSGRLRIEPEQLHAAGPFSVHARTWFGRDVVKAIGKDKLLGLPNTELTSWGGIKLDLIEEPWTGELEELAERQREINGKLAKWGVLGDFSESDEPVPGKNWVPPRWKF